MNTYYCLEGSFHKYEHEGHARVRFAWNDPNMTLPYDLTDSSAKFDEIHLGMSRQYSKNVSKISTATTKYYLYVIFS